MTSIITVGKFIIEHFADIVMALGALLSAIIAILLIIPGNQGETTIQAIADFIKKFNVKSIELGSSSDSVSKKK